MLSALLKPREVRTESQSPLLENPETSTEESEDSIPDPGLRNRHGSKASRPSRAILPLFSAEHLGNVLVALL
jgi:hypothetical protein